MAWMISLCLGSIWASAVSALVIQSSEQIQPQGTEPGPVPIQLYNVTAKGRVNDSVLPLPINGILDHRYNTSLSRLNLSVPPVFDCDEGWGRFMNLQSCREAFTHIPWMMAHEQRPVSFGPREAGTFNVGLPKRWMSSDGTCGIQPWLVPGEESAFVAPFQAYLATAALIERCVGGNPPMGGQARDFGGDMNLVVVVGDYDPHFWSNNVRCFGSVGGPGIVDSCNVLADQMKATESPITFGPRGQTHESRTPYTQQAADNRCYFKVTSHPNNRYEKTTSWYDIWGAVVHVNAMCIRHGEKGAFKVYADDMSTHWLEVEVGDLQAQATS